MKLFHLHRWVTKTVVEWYGLAEKLQECSCGARRRRRTRARKGKKDLKARRSGVHRGVTTALKVAPREPVPPGDAGRRFEAEEIGE